MEQTRKTKRKRRSPLWPLALVILLAAFLAVAWQLVLPHLPSSEEVGWYQGEMLLVTGDQVFDAPPARTEEGSFLLPLSFVLEHLDDTVFWEPDHDAVTITTGQAVLRMRTEQLTAHMNREPLPLSVPVLLVDGEPHLPLPLLSDLYGLSHDFHQTTQTLVVEAAGSPRQVARVKDETPARVGPDVKAPIIARPRSGDEVLVFSEESGWYRIRTPEGILGYVPKDRASLEGIRENPAPKPPSRPAWRPMGERIILTWDYVGGTGDRAARFSEYPPMPGVNVISPTWFHLKDQEGNLVNLADPEYVQWAHDQGYQVWALVSNGFDPDRTSPVLRDPEIRDHLIKQLLAYSSLYDLDGINVDFENMYQEDRDYFSQFIRELSPLAREQGLTVSIDVTAISQSPTWSLCYDRPALAQAADYLMLMAYDQHPAASQVAGPVAALDWTERVLTRMLEQVPRDQLILGIPLYTRLWKEEPLAGGGVQVSSQALSMAARDRVIEEHSAELEMDESTGLWLATYEEGPTTYKIWIEDEESIRWRAQLADRFGLPGVATWRRGFEHPGVWEVLRDELRGPPH